MGYFCLCALMFCLAYMGKSLLIYPGTEEDFAGICAQNPLARELKVVWPKERGLLANILRLIDRFTISCNY